MRLRCSGCGGLILLGRCVCERTGCRQLVYREWVVLAVLIAATVTAFLATRAVARGNEARQRRLAAAWFAAAQQAAREGNLDTAIDRFRRAVLKDPGDRHHRLALAEALVARRFEPEAKRVLLGLRDAEPEDPVTNLLLARLERGQHRDIARRYYQNALSGLWRPTQAIERRRVRLELIEFLLADGDRARALSELLLVTPNLPGDADLRSRIGRMFLAAGDPRLAKQQFDSAIRLQPEHRAALAGAGEAAFELGDYSGALRYLSAAPPADGRTAELRQVAQFVVDLDPLAPRLGSAERRRRLRQMLQHAEQRLHACVDGSAGPPSPIFRQLRAQIAGLLSALNRAGHRENRDLVDDGVGMAFRAGRTAQKCGAPAAAIDRAFLILGERYGFDAGD